MSTSTPIVGIIMGSKSDWETMKIVCGILDDLGIAYEAKALSAHRNPTQVHVWASTAKDRGIRVVIAAAGMAAALPGVVAAVTPLPVLGVPMETGIMGGLDSLLSIAQMPGGIPVGGDDGHPSREPLGGGLADAACRTRYYCNPAVEPLHTPPILSQ